MENMNKIPLREEIPAEDKWALEDLYPSDESWEQALAAFEKAGQELAGYAGRLCESADVLYAYLTKMEQVNEDGSRLANYCMRKSDEDTRDPVYQAMKGKFMGAYVALSAQVSFETPEIIAISDETMEAFYASCSGLNRYRRYRSNLRRM